VLMRDYFVEQPTYHVNFFRRHFRMQVSISFFC
jgi:hypothetical protein